MSSKDTDLPVKSNDGPALHVAPDTRVSLYGRPPIMIEPPVMVPSPPTFENSTFVQCSVLLIYFSLARMIGCVLLWSLP